MTKIEKVIIGFMAALVIVLVVSISFTISAVNEAGGVRSLVIDAGKDIKEIAKEINAD